MPRLIPIAMLLGLWLVASAPALAVPDPGAPLPAGPPTTLQEPLIFPTWRLSIQLPEGWVAEESAEGLRFTSDDWANSGLLLSEELELLPETFGSKMQAAYSPTEEGVTLIGLGEGQVAGIAIPMAEVRMELGEGGTLRQLLALYEFSPEEYPLLAVASGPESRWADLQPLFEGMLASIRPVLSEEEAFNRLEDQ